jgi:hypothetical protein
MPYDGDLDHSIIERPWEFDIDLVSYHNNPVDDRHSYVDLTLRREKIVRRLRFLGPRDFQIERGFPTPTRGMCILDVRHRQLEGMGVRVANFEASVGAITFWAREVIDLGALKPSYKPGDRVVMLKHSDWKADARATIVSRGRPRTVYDGTIHMEYFSKFEEHQTDLTDESAGHFIEYEGTSVLEEYIRLLDATNPAWPTRQRTRPAGNRGRRRTCIAAKDGMLAFHARVVQRRGNRF